MIRIAGDQSLNEQANQLASLEESYQLKKISIDEYELKKVILIFEWLFGLEHFSNLCVFIQQRAVLLQLVDFGYCLSPQDKKFLENKTDSEILESIDDGLS